jgi:hypothetical protein
MHARDLGRAAATAIAIVLVAAGTGGCADPRVRPAPTAPVEWTGRLTVETFDDVEVFGGPGFEVLRHPVSAGGGFAILGEVGGDGPRRQDAWLSPDGRHWERIQGIPAMNDAYLVGIAEAPGGSLVAAPQIGPDAVTWRSTDAGRSWSATELPDAPAGTSFGAITAGAGGVLVSGSQPRGGERVPRLWWSRDGADWTAVVMRDEVFGGAEVRAIAAVSTGFVAVGGRRTEAPVASADPLGGMRAAAFRSADGVTWEAALVDDAPPINVVLAGADGIVAYGFADNLSDTLAWASTDGTTWRSRPDERESATAWFAVHQGQISRLRSRADGMASSLELAVSSNGVDWTIAGTGTTDRTGGIGVIAAGEPGLIQVGGTGEDVQLWFIPWPKR